jgi:hypothetical protein
MQRIRPASPQTGRLDFLDFKCGGMSHPRKTPPFSSVSEIFGDFLSLMTSPSKNSSDDSFMGCLLKLLWAVSILESNVQLIQSEYGSRLQSHGDSLATLQTNLETVESGFSKRLEDVEAELYLDEVRLTEIERDFGERVPQLESFVEVIRERQVTADQEMRSAKFEIDSLSQKTDERSLKFSEELRTYNSRSSNSKSIRSTIGIQRLNLKS